MSSLSDSIWFYRGAVAVLLAANGRAAIRAWIRQSGRPGQRGLRRGRCHREIALGMRLIVLLTTLSGCWPLISSTGEDWGRVRVEQWPDNFALIAPCEGPGPYKLRASVAGEVQVVPLEGATSLAEALKAAEAIGYTAHSCGSNFDPKTLTLSVH